MPQKSCFFDLKVRLHFPGAALATLLFFCAAPLVAQIRNGDPPVAQEQQEEDDLEELSDLSLEDLLNIEVTSVSKSSQPLSSSPAAIFVVTQDDIQRAGARSIPEALRLVPGIEVSQINRHRWAVTSRGFNSVFASKMLVLMDGRTLYTPLFSGTFWNQQSTPVENIERIEVIRGPGATLWGENAVNGIINIITRHAKDTIGGQAKTILGTNNLEGYLRYGVALNDSTYLRIYGQFFDRDDYVDGQGNDTHADWNTGQVGFRLDSELSPRDTLTVQGDAYRGNAEQTIDISDPLALNLAGILQDTINLSGGNLISRWHHRLGEDNDLTLQLYVDHTRRRDGLFSDSRTTLDLDFQHRFVLGDSHHIIWGLGYRFIKDDFDGTFQIFADPESRNYQVFSAFVQDEITIIDDELRLIVGTKISHNDFSGLEIQPSVRMIWTPNATHTLWAAVSRAVETPSRSTQDLTLRVAPTDLGLGPIIPQIRENDNARSIDVLALELGYRVRPADGLSFDLALFYNDYEHLATDDILGVTFLGALPLLDIVNQNRARGESYGLELSSDWRPFHSLRLSLSYSWISIQIHSVGSTDPDVNSYEGASPNHRIVFRAAWDITDELEFNTTLYWVDNIPTDDIPSWVRLDFQMRWQVTENLELAAGVRNVLDARHEEFKGTFGRRSSQVERTAYFWMDFRF